MSQSDPECKLILLGNGSVGKSSIICRFVDDGFTRVYKQTVGLDFFEKRLNLRGDKRVLLQVHRKKECFYHNSFLDRYGISEDRASIVL